MSERNNTFEEKSDPRRNLPSVAILLESPEIMGLIKEYSRLIILDAINESLDWFRANLKNTDSTPTINDVIEKIKLFLLNIESERLRPVVNATGIILHTGLGRAVLPQNAAAALSQLNRCCNLQIDLKTGQRGKRNFMTEFLLCKLTGAESAMIVNNNAAATFLILSALCKGKEVIISRGQLIEIGGSYRLPDCIRQSGAIMVEVGTTNKTHFYDYENAITENTAAILRVNPSNYRIIGFSEDVPISELVKLKQKQGLIVVDDLGCGALINFEEYGLPKEPTVQDSISAGADLVCFSGDKLIGGPQAGIIVGKKHLIARIKKHPLMRMLRVCKLTDFALQETLRLFLNPETLIKNNPTLCMITTPIEEIKKRAIRLKKMIEREKLSITIRLIEGESAVGGGSLPTSSIKTFLLGISSPTHSPDRLSYLLRQNEVPIITRIKNDVVLIDVRTLLKGDDRIIYRALTKIAKS